MRRTPGCPRPAAALRTDHVHPAHLRPAEPETQQGPGRGPRRDPAPLAGPLAGEAITPRPTAPPRPRSFVPALFELAEAHGLTLRPGTTMPARGPPAAAPVGCLNWVRPWRPERIRGRGPWPPDARPAWPTLRPMAGRSGGLCCATCCGPAATACPWPSV